MKGGASENEHFGKARELFFFPIMTNYDINFNIVICVCFLPTALSLKKSFTTTYLTVKRITNGRDVGLSYAVMTPWPQFN